ncbi:hypothetical protein FQN53_006657 [Emmonsiellopsis sp. PD_33]|nr:hypothetical protein FQN53_006657 [Emmonsiellopsis sp. PD_33]
MAVSRLSVLLPVLSLLADAVDVSWHPPRSTAINDVEGIMDREGVYGFIFNSSQTPNEEYGTYNWCNMPHARKREYKVPPKEYKLEYVEVIHRHHKRTPYASNTFPEEAYPWHCDDQGLFYYGQPLPHGHSAAQTYWSIFQNPINPFKPPGFNGSCTFPQITKEGLDDSWQHGRDLYGVYHDLLHFIPKRLDLDKVSYHVTTNVITSQVAGMVINGMYNPKKPVPLNVEPPTTDSLEPTYPCPKSTTLFSTSKTTPNTTWTRHLTLTTPLLTSLDSISGIPTDPSDDWHTSVDHYFDNLSARLCHSKPLPCSLTDSNKCISQTDAETIFRLGQFEYSYIYRDAPTSLAASAGSMGVFAAGVAERLRERISGVKGGVVYRHNIAHDGSMSRLLSVLQVEVMVWPGMGAEVVFELYRRRGGRGKGVWFVRVLFGGEVLVSSSPALGRLDMVPVQRLLGYFDGLVGERAGGVEGLCMEEEE